MAAEDSWRETRRRGVRRTLWVTGTIAVLIFLLSIWRMLKTG
ncbi:hypothetical protein [Aerosticca soli]|jgi:hypothetical protein|uniref:Uncharacterized protein n=1 Tax=Aerosticca soli TaxID=2010829 RepID=A0A2Z6E1Z3_9GAMM|nr:hypothetical protein [Aerosticca soli]MDI3263085.1 hypothetical protein [Fulvimonas sp.]BBD79053.1 hypothetical protein ALSL_0382 [Aerosticca soli]